jgi:hypothetical protein
MCEKGGVARWNVAEAANRRGDEAMRPSLGALALPSAWEQCTLVTQPRFKHVS